MNRSFVDVKRQELQNRQANLIEEYQVANAQLSQVVSDVERVKIDRQIRKIEKELQEVEQELSNQVLPLTRETVEINVAVIAMTQQDAAQLETKVDLVELDRLKTALHNFQIEDIVSCYGESRNDWIPLFVEQPRSIKSIIEELVARLNRSNINLPGRPEISVRYLSDQFLSSVAAERRDAWDMFEGNGGVLIVDAVSIYHQQIRDHLLKSQLISANNSIAMIVLSPLRSSAITVNEILHSQVYGAHLERAFNYFIDHLNPFYEFGVADIYSLQRWLFTTIPKIRCSGLTPEVRAAIQAQVGVIPSGIGSIVTGGMLL